jgi:heptosyltransferase-3
MKVLVIKRDKLGDLLLTTPMLAQLKHAMPQAEVHLLANDYNAWVVEGNPHIDRLWVYRRVRSGGRVSLPAAWEGVWQGVALRGQSFDWVIVANGDESPRAIVRGEWVKGKRLVAVCVDPKKYPGVTDPIAPDKSLHEMDRLLALLAPIGIPVPRNPELPKYSLPAKSAAFALQWLSERKLRPDGYIVLGLGARRAKKQPSTAQVLSWTAHFKKEWGLDTVFMWTPGKSHDPMYPGDDEVAQPVLDAKAPQIFPHRGPIWEALGLIWSAKTSIFPDSGLMHFAAASPGGVLGFFAETDVSPSPTQWAPRGARGRWIEAPLAVQELADELVLAEIKRLVQ